MEIIQNTKTEFLQAKEGMVKAFVTTPDERINWAPSPTARTPVQQVAHSAAAIGHITEMLSGNVFAPQTTEEADKGFREWEQQFSTREEVLALLNQNSDAFITWLDNVTPEQLGGMATLPFNLGTAPIQAMMSAPASHTRFHTAQMEYTQTIYGDQDWHLNG
ncbi:MAG: DinB family protein [Armatimonas sp.]